MDFPEYLLPDAYQRDDLNVWIFLAVALQEKEGSREALLLEILEKKG